MVVYGLNTKRPMQPPFVLKRQIVAVLKLLNKEMRPEVHFGHGYIYWMPLQMACLNSLTLCLRIGHKRLLNKESVSN